MKGFDNRRFRKVKKVNMNINNIYCHRDSDPIRPNKSYDINTKSLPFLSTI